MWAVFKRPPQLFIGGKFFPAPIDKLMFFSAMLFSKKPMMVALLVQNNCLMLLNKVMNAIMILEIEKWIENHANLSPDGVYSWRI